MSNNECPDITVIFFKVYRSVKCSKLVICVPYLLQFEFKKHNIKSENIILKCIFIANGIRGALLWNRLISHSFALY